MLPLLRTILTASLILLSATADAQLFKRRARAGEVPPKALLVELLTRPTQRAYLKANRPDLLAEFDHDVEAVIQRTVIDFSRYFDYCPVFYFYDSSADGVRDKQWSTVLLDSTRRPVGAQSVLSEGDTNFYIAYYGSPIPQPEVVRPRSAGDLGPLVEHYGDDPTSLIKELLLVSDHNFRVLPERMPRTNYVRNLRPPNISRMDYRFIKGQLFYDSKRWEVDYTPCAYSYAATLRRYFRKK